MQVIENCTLEWDEKRGVLYVHNKETGATVLRICRLRTDLPFVKLSEGQIDLTGPFQFSSYPIKEMNDKDRNMTKIEIRSSTEIAITTKDGKTFTSDSLNAYKAIEKIIGVVNELIVKDHHSNDEKEMNETKNN